MLKHGDTAVEFPRRKYVTPAAPTALRYGASMRDLNWLIEVMGSGEKRGIGYD